MLEKIKWFTQRVTFILQAIFCLGFTAGTIKLLDLTGLWSTIDSLYLSNPFLFLVMGAVSRLLLAAGCLYVCDKVITLGQRTGYFSVEPERFPHYIPDNMNKLRNIFDIGLKTNEDK